MAANDKYTKVMKGLKPKKAVEEKPEPGKSRGGKRSNPKYRGTTFFLEKDALLEANRRLLDSSMDLSDLLNSLLREWLAKP